MGIEREEDDARSRPDVPEKEQHAYIEWEAGRERLYVATRTEASQGPALWVVPIPSKPEQVTVEPIQAFPLVGYIVKQSGWRVAWSGIGWALLLGLAPLSGNNWGIMLNLAWVRGAIFFKQSLLYILAPVLAISLLQFSIVTMTRSLEDIFNPRLRGA